MATLFDLTSFIVGINSEDHALQLDGVQKRRRVLGIDNPPIQQIVDTCVVPRLVHLLAQDATPHVQFESAWALVNIASGTTECNSALIKHGAVPVFVRLLSSPSCDVKEQAVWALGTIAATCPPR